MAFKNEMKGRELIIPLIVAWMIRELQIACCSYPIKNILNEYICLYYSVYSNLFILVGSLLPPKNGTVFPVQTGSLLPVSFKFEGLVIQNVVYVWFSQTLLFPVDVPMFFELV